MTYIKLYYYAYAYVLPHKKFCHTDEYKAL